EAANRCEVVIAGEEGVNSLFFGEDVLFEGHKTGIEGGFGWTAIYTDRPWLRTRIRIFDLYFASAHQYTLRTFGPKSDGSPRDDPCSLREAVISAVEKMKAGDV